MITIDIDKKEKDVLETVIESYLSDLRMEIADTDNMDFREGLKEKKAILNKVITELKKAG